MPLVIAKTMVREIQGKTMTVVLGLLIQHLVIAVVSMMGAPTHLVETMVKEIPEKMMAKATQGRIMKAEGMTMGTRAAMILENGILVTTTILARMMTLGQKAGWTTSKIFLVEKHRLVMVQK